MAELNAQKIDAINKQVLPINDMIERLGLTTLLYEPYHTDEEIIRNYASNSWLLCDDNVINIQINQSCSAHGNTPIFEVFAFFGEIIDKFGVYNAPSRLKIVDFLEYKQFADMERILKRFLMIVNKNDGKDELVGNN